MEFQFPANPQVGDTVKNETTGVNYVWVLPGKWRVTYGTTSTIPTPEALIETVQELSNVIIDLQTKVNTLESTSFLILE